MLQTDSSRIQQVLINLIVNASKFTKTGSITIGLEVRDDEAYFSVTDTGAVLLPNSNKRYSTSSKN
jgi:signal transduction histidine kinase